MGSDEIHEILRIKSHKIQWDLMKFMKFFKHQIWWNPLESDEIYEILSIKSHEIQWDLMKFMVLSIKSDEIH